MANFKAFKPEAMERIARSLGYEGDMSGFQDYLNKNPKQHSKMESYKQKAIKMAVGGVVKLQEGGDTSSNESTEGTPPADTTENNQGIMGDTISNINDPTAPENTTLSPTKLPTDSGGEIGEGKGGLDSTYEDYTPDTGDTSKASDPDDMDTTKYDATQIGDQTPKTEVKTLDKDKINKIEAAQGKLSPEEQEEYDKAFEHGQAQVTRNATVQGRLAEMNKDLQEGRIPPYAQAAARAAQAMMASRGLSSSSMAGGAIANAIMEASIPIAKQDASTYAEYGLANASNKMKATLTKAMALSTLNVQNLNNRQQAVVENSKAFLEVDLANLKGEQAAAITDSQNRLQTLLSDQSQDNAAKNFNASSDNQTKQFMASLTSNIEQFNAAQLNTMEQFNAGEINSAAEFNRQMKNNREQFEATNQLAIEQFNAKWKQTIATTDTAATNYANEFNAKSLLDISKTAYSNMWTHMSDMLEHAWTSGENGLDRVKELTIAEIEAKMEMYKSDLNLSAAQSAGLGTLFGEILTNPLAGSFMGRMFGITK